MNKIRKSRFTRILAIYLSFQIFNPIFSLQNLYALNGGPSQPEYASFTPAGTTEMVDLASGDFAYNIPVMDVGGYPINLAYNSGVTMDQEASWVGLGWNLNVGHINRQVRGIPDDFNGDKIIYENNLRDNFTAGVNTGLEFPIFGRDILGKITDTIGGLNLGIGMQYNNYEGISYNLSYGASFDISESVSAGLNISSASGGEANVEPSIGITTVIEGAEGTTSKALTSNIGVPFNSNQGLQGLNLSASTSRPIYDKNQKFQFNANGGLGGFLSFNDNLSFFPTNQLGYENYNLTLRFALGTEIYGPEGPQQSVTGFGSLQKLRKEDKYRKVNGYGFSYTQNAPTINSVLDFNRENDRTVTSNTNMLPIVNQTYDIYSINAQGLGGMFRPFKSEIGNVFDETISYTGTGVSASFELGPGAGAHFGTNVKVNPSQNRSGRWEDSSNPLLNNFRYRGSNDYKYEETYFRKIGELASDPDSEYTNSLVSSKYPIRPGISGSKYNRKTNSRFEEKNYSDNHQINYQNINSDPIKRSARYPRSQNIEMVKYGDANAGFDPLIRTDKLPTQINGNAYQIPYDHYVGVKVLNPNGSKYIFGETAYNTSRIEAFCSQYNDGDIKTVLVHYTSQKKIKK